jgi:hypothetical protein
MNRIERLFAILLLQVGRRVTARAIAAQPGEGGILTKGRR